MSTVRCGRPTINNVIRCMQMTNRLESLTVVCIFIKPFRILSAKRCYDITDIIDASQIRAKKLNALDL